MSHDPTHALERCGRTRRRMQRRTQQSGFDGDVAKWQLRRTAVTPGTPWKIQEELKSLLKK